MDYFESCTRAQYYEHIRDDTSINSQSDYKSWDFIGPPILFKIKLTVDNKTPGLIWMMNQNGMKNK